MTEWRIEYLSESENPQILAGAAVIPSERLLVRISLI